MLSAKITVQAKSKNVSENLPKAIKDKAKRTGIVLKW
jgi:hypothetical protein